VSTHKAAARGAGQRVSEWKRSSEGCQLHGIQKEGCGNISLPSRTVIKRNPNANLHTHTLSGEEAAMVDGGTKVQMPISRRAHSPPPTAPGGLGNLPAPHSTHTEAPAAAAYVPAEARPSEQPQGGKPKGQARGSARGTFLDSLMSSNVSSKFFLNMGVHFAISAMKLPCSCTHKTGTPKH
jgi:hypothetical protein